VPASAQEGWSLLSPPSPLGGEGKGEGEGELLLLLPNVFFPWPVHIGHLLGDWVWYRTNRIASPLLLFPPFKSLLLSPLAGRRSRYRGEGRGEGENVQAPLAKGAWGI
jgi:hypothetical protein